MMVNPYDDSRLMLHVLSVTPWRRGSNPFIVEETT